MGSGPAVDAASVVFAGVFAKHLPILKAYYLQSAGFSGRSSRPSGVHSQPVEIYEFILIIWIYLEGGRGAPARILARRGH
jgi:hypothetical protein